MFKPRDYQAWCIADAAAFFASAQRGDKRLYVAPTGTGKSVPELEILAAHPEAVIVTPKDEIADGLEAKGADPNRIWTPVRLRNRLLSGAVVPPRFVIWDEVHHQVAESWAQIDLLCGLAPSIGFTATYYRGNPKSTRALREVWGEPIVLLTMPEASRLGYLAFPTLHIEPLVDDDQIDVVNGEFEITRLEAATRNRLADLVHHCSRYYDGHLWDRPTIVSLPSRAICRDFVAACDAVGLPMFAIHAGTTHEMRRTLFDVAVGRTGAFCHVNVVTEGVDLPLRRLIDAQPILSPNKWMQQFGRITRPVPAGEAPPEYVGTNRNLLRHAWLLEGCIPIPKLAEATAVFPPSDRDAATRAFGLEALGRFKPTSVRLQNGLRLTAYALSCLEGNAITQYIALIHPLKTEPIWARRENARTPDGKVFGRWSACTPPGELQGFKSIGPKRLTPKMQGWWERAAPRFGLEPDDVDRKAFTVLPVLNDLNLRFV